MSTRFPFSCRCAVFLLATAAFTTAAVTNEAGRIVIEEAPLRGEAMSAFPAMGWVNQQLTGIQAAAANRSVDDEVTSTLLFAPDGQPNQITVLDTDFASVSNRWGSITNWAGLCFWIQGCGTPSFATLAWGPHETLVRTDLKHWRKVHIPWDYWVPRIDPGHPPAGPLRIRLTREPRMPTMTVVCADPLSPEHPTGRDWSKMKPYEAKIVTAQNGLLLKNDVIGGSATGLTFLAKVGASPVYARVAWIGAREQGRSFLVTSNFWQRITVPFSSMPRPDELDRTMLRISLEDYPYHGVWAVFDRLHLFTGIADEPVQPRQRAEPQVNLPAGLWIQRREVLDDFREQLTKARLLPRILIITDSSHSGVGLAYLGQNPDTLLQQNAWHRLGRVLKRHYRFKNESVTQEVFIEQMSRWQNLGDSLDPFQNGIRIHVMHGQGLMNLMRGDLVKRIQTYDPQILILAVGSQDVDATPDDTYRRHLETLLSQCQAPNRQLVIASPVPVLDARMTSVVNDASFLRRSLSFRGICADLAEKHGLPFVDVTLALLYRGTSFAGGYYTTHGLLNHRGHRQLVNLYTRLLADREVNLWDDLPEPIALQSTDFDVDNYVAVRKRVDPDLSLKPEITRRPSANGRIMTKEEARLRIDLEAYLNFLQAELMEWDDTGTLYRR